MPCSKSKVGAVTCFLYKTEFSNENSSCYTWLEFAASREIAVSNLASDPGLRVGRYLDKRWDWGAFPANAGYPELERAQMRIV